MGPDPSRGEAWQYTGEAACGRETVLSSFEVDQRALVEVTRTMTRILTRILIRILTRILMRMLYIYTRILTA